VRAAPGPFAGLRAALADGCALVGTVLNLVNQGDVWLAGGGLTYWKVGLTFLVPFCVATYGAWSMALESAQLEGVSGAGHPAKG
jgi:hypothetical protein